MHEIVLDFSLFNCGSILANSFFKSIDFANNKNNQENFTSENSISENSIFKNSTSGIIYKGGN